MTTPPKKLERISTSWRDGPHFLEHLTDSGGTRALFCPYQQDRPLPPLSAGALVELQIAFSDREATFRLHARLLEVIDEPPQRGVQLALLAEEHGRQELVLACAEGDSLPYFHRRHPRLSCFLRATLWLPGGESLPTHAVTISEGGGSFAEGQAVTSVGMTLEAEITFADQTLRLRARVRSVVDRGPRPQVGVEFLFGSPEQRAHLTRAVERLRQRAEAD